MKKIIGIISTAFLYFGTVANAQSGQNGQPASASKNAVLSSEQTTAPAGDSIGTTAIPAKSGPVSGEGQSAPSIAPPDPNTQQSGEKKKPQR